MSDPVPINPAPASAPSTDTDREARIEELLLSGLDHYFGGRYERAISIWTRIIFLDRHHDRARAYIERARSAVAERQRESEELLHEGVAAYNAGNVEQARTLLARAVQQGSDTADVLLDRLERADAPLATGGSHAPFRSSMAARPRRRAAATRQRGWTMSILGGFLLALVMLVGGLPIGVWLYETQFAPAALRLQPLPETPLPVVTPSEATLDRARLLYEEGRLHDALRALDGISRGDVARAAADRLQAEIQRNLLGGATTLTRPAEDPSQP
jgi:tetratricopeptide (TPR) repeat protein